jgi:septum formation topological specificity factor MinE
MSTARRQIVEVLNQRVDHTLTPDLVDRLADELLPVVRDTVARGLDNAAIQLASEGWFSAPRRLREWAGEARSASVELPELPDDVAPLAVVVLVKKGDPIDEDEAVKVAGQAVRRAIRNRTEGN